MFLPCITHRVNFLLIAEELRLRLIADGIDDGRGQQIYKLDIDYGNYDAREKIIEEESQELQPNNLLPQEEFKKAIKDMQSKEKILSNKKVFKSGEKMVLPVDLERDWLNVTAVDIENYATFVLRNKDLSNCRLVRPDKKLKALSLTDSEDRKEIKLLNLKGKNCCIQQKDLIKVLTTSNSGKNFF